MQCEKRRVNFRVNPLPQVLRYGLTAVASLMLSWPTSDFCCQMSGGGKNANAEGLQLKMAKWKAAANSVLEV